MVLSQVGEDGQEGKECKMGKMEFDSAAYSFSVVHRAGAVNRNADALSRASIELQEKGGWV